MFCQTYFYFLFESLWKNSLRPVVVLPIQCPEQWKLQTSLQQGAAEYVQKVHTYLQTSIKPFAEQQHPPELEQCIDPKIPPCPWPFQ